MNFFHKQKRGNRFKMLNEYTQHITFKIYAFQNFLINSLEQGFQVDTNFQS